MKDRGHLPIVESKRSNHFAWSRLLVDDGQSPKTKTSALVGYVRQQKSEFNY